MACSRRRGLLGALAMAALPLGGCASMAAVQTQRLLDQPGADLPRRIELTDTPFHPQTLHQCGPAALATVLGAAGLPSDPLKLADEVYVPARQGSLQIEMLAAARRAGAVAFRLPPSLRALVRQVAEGVPVLVLQNLGLSIAPQWHYAVVVGYDLDRQVVVLRSGTEKREEMSLQTLELTWARSGRWAFVAVQPGQMPGQVTEAAAVDALVAFERGAAPDTAARAYAAAWRRWPGNLALGLGLGNARYAAEDYYAAAMVFLNTAERHDSAPAWNNLARTRLKLGRPQAALDAARRAVSRAEAAEPRWLAPARATLDEVQRAVRTGDRPMRPAGG